VLFEGSEERELGVSIYDFQKYGGNDLELPSGFD